MLLCLWLGLASSAQASSCSTTWNGSAWSNGAPTASSDVCVTGPLVVTGTPTWNSVTVESGGGVRIGGVEACPGTSDSLTLAAGGEISSGGELDVFSSSSCAEGGPGTLTVSAGTLTNDGTLELSNCTSIGGSVCSGGSRTVTGNVTNDADGQVNVSGTTPSLQGGTFDNQGSMAIGGTATSGVLDLSASETLVNAGTIAIDPNGTLTLGIDSGGTYEQTAGGTITGQAATVQGGTLDLLGGDSASFDVVAPSTLAGNVYAGQTITTESTANSGCAAAGDLTATGSFTNAGTINVDESNCQEAKLILPSGGTVTNTGTLTTMDCQCAAREIDGSITNAGGTINFGDRTSIAGSGTSFTQTSGTTTVTNVLNLQSGPGVIELEGGTLEGINSLNGPKIQGSVDNTGGTVQTSAASTEFTLDGNYTQGQNATLDAIVGSEPTLNVQGLATVDGTLQIVTPSGFTPTTGDNYPVIDTQVMQGTFATVNGQFPSAGTGYNVQYNTASEQPGYTPGVFLTAEMTSSLTVTPMGTGGGTVTSTPNGIDCGSTCSAQFFTSQQVTLTASAATGSTFAGWGGDCSGTATTCSLTMSAAHSVTATFSAAAPHNLSVSLAGTGSGSVTSTPAGIDCGSTCSGSFPNGQAVTLTAAAAAGSYFAGWTGDCSGSGATCQLTMDSDHSASATFTLTPSGSQVLSVTTSGAGSGSVTSTPAGIDCGATCSAPFSDGQLVTLTATAAQGSYFSGWSGDCSGASQTCQLTLSAARTVGAGFALNPTGPPRLILPDNPLPPGVTFGSAWGQTASGVPRVGRGMPFTMRIPLDLPPTGPPNSTLAWSGFTGVAETSPTGGVNYAIGMYAFATQYGPDGAPIAVSAPVSGTIRCGAPAGGGPDPCALLWSQLNQPYGGATLPNERGRAARGRPPVAHAAACPPQYYSQLDIQPEGSNGVTIVNHIPGQEDSSWTFLPAQLLPEGVFKAENTGPVDNTIGVALQNSFVDLANLPVAVVASPYNAWVASMRSEGFAEHSTTNAQAATYYANAAVQMSLGDTGLTSLGGFSVLSGSHGEAAWVENTIAAQISTGGTLGNSIIEDANTQLQNSYVDCPPRTHNLKRGAFYIDPSGTVETTQHAPIDDATVTLSRSPSAKGRQVKVPNGSHLMSPGNRSNPDRTNLAGQYGWDVAPGYYQISASHQGCRAPHGSGRSVLSRVLPVPPAQTGITLLLLCPNIRRTHARLTLVAQHLKSATGDGYRLTATVVGARGRAPSGTLTFALGRLREQIALDPMTHVGVLFLPAFKLPRSISVNYSGDARYLPTRARARS